MPGKFDDLAELVRREVDADVAVVLIVGGKRGPGMSITSRPGPAHESALAELPDKLEMIARHLRARGAAERETVVKPNFRRDD